MRAAAANSFDIAVVGGGLLGAATAWGLAMRTVRVGVLDEGDVAHRAWRGNFALVWVQGKGLGMPEYQAWTRRSSDSWAEFAETLARQSGIDVRFRRPGGFHLALSDDELANRSQTLQRLHNQTGMASIPYEILNHRQVKSMLPEIGPEVVGGSYCPLDGHVNVLRLMRALHAGLARSRASYLPNRKVERIDPLEGGFRLSTAAGEVHAGKIVLAAGNDNARLAPMVGLHAPVAPQRGHIIVTERTAPFLDHPIVTVRQTDEGSVMIGDSAEDVGFDTSVETGVLAAMARRAVRMFPRIGRLNVVRTWSALRVMTADGFPIYQQSAAYPGAFLAACHSGVTLAANHALVLAPAIAAGNLLGADFLPFNARRFDVPTT